MSLTRRALIGAAPAAALVACGRHDDAANAAPAASVRPLKDAAPFRIGACLMTAELDDPQFVDLVQRNFSQVTPEWEMKMERILAADGALTFDAADRIAGFCRDNRLALHGTTLVWYAQDPPAFEALTHDRTGFEDHLRDYIRQVVGRYRGLARGWDVVNEAVAEDGNGYRGGVWAAGLGDDFARLPFEMAREADPDAVLFLNDYNLESIPAKLDAFQRLAERLLKAGAPLTGLGTQSHLGFDTPPGQAGAAVKALARFGLPIHVSELDITTHKAGLSLGGPSDPARLKAQARVAAEIAEAFAELAAAQRYAFTIWGVRDRDSWLRGSPQGALDDAPLLFDDAGAPKPALAAVEAAFASRR
jgi:endo-1,4-beta-xylanase